MTPGQLANRILNAAGTHLRHYEMAQSRKNIIEAAQSIIDELSTNSLQLPNSNGDLENEY